MTDDEHNEEMNRVRSLLSVAIAEMPEETWISLSKDYRLEVITTLLAMDNPPNFVYRLP